MAVETNLLLDFLAKIQAARRQQEAVQPATPTMPEWSKRLDPNDFQGRTREEILKAQALSQAAKGDLQLMPPSVAGPKADKLPMPPVEQMPAEPPAEPAQPPMPEPAIPVPPPPQPAPVASPAPQDINMRQALEPHVGGVGGSYIDMVRRARQTGEMPGGAPRPQGQAPEMRPEPAGHSGGGGGGLPWRAILGGAGALMQELDGQRGAMGNFVQARNARIGANREANQTRQAAVMLGIDPEFAATAPISVLMPLLGDAYKQRNAGPDYAYEKMDDGTLVRVDKRTGKTEPVYQAGNKPTSAIQEYEYAKAQGFPGTLADYEREMKQAGTSRTVGAPMPGYRYEYDQQGNPVQAVPIPGSPADMEARAIQKKTESREMAADRSSAIVTDDIRRATELASGGWTTGLAGTALREIPSTDAHNLVKVIDTIKANVGFDRLQQMRESSPTGGALGPVSDFENRMLQSVLGSLETSQGQEQLLYNLNRLNEVYLDIIHGPGNRPGTEAPAQPATQATPQGAAPQPGAVEDGYRFKGGNPADPANWEPVQ
jgi:hypothetical protein